jgi:hypothetical protein
MTVDEFQISQVHRYEALLRIGYTEAIIQQNTSRFRNEPFVVPPKQVENQDNVIHVNFGDKNV